MFTHLFVVFSADIKALGISYIQGRKSYIFVSSDFKFLLRLLTLILFFIVFPLLRLVYSEAQSHQQETHRYRITYSRMQTVLLLYAVSFLYKFKNTRTISYTHTASRILPENKSQLLCRESQDADSREFKGPWRLTVADFPQTYS